MIEVVEVPATVLASVRAEVAWSELVAAIGARFDRVYAFLRTAPVRQDGHNVCIYHAPSQRGVELEVGVQVSGRFDGADGVLCSTTPAGRAAHIVHAGPYNQLGAAHDALAAFCKERGGVAWEVYGDWSDDPARLRTDVYRLIP